MHADIIKMEKTKKAKRDLQILAALRGDIIVRKRIHQGWIEYNRLPFNIRRKMKCYFGMWHYTYSNERGDISLVQLLNTFPNSMRYKNAKYYWEAYSNDKLFNDVVRFDTKKKAEKFICDTLGGQISKA